MLSSSGPFNPLEFESRGARITVLSLTPSYRSKSGFAYKYIKWSSLLSLCLSQVGWTMETMLQIFTQKVFFFCLFMVIRKVFLNVTISTPHSQILSGTRRIDPGILKSQTKLMNSCPSFSLSRVRIVIRFQSR